MKRFLFERVMDNKKNIDKYGDETAKFAAEAIAVFCQEKENG